MNKNVQVKLFSVARTGANTGPLSISRALAANFDPRMLKSVFRRPIPARRSALKRQRAKAKSGLVPPPPSPQSPH